MSKGEETFDPTVAKTTSSPSYHIVSCASEYTDYFQISISNIIIDDNLPYLVLSTQLTTFQHNLMYSKSLLRIRPLNPLSTLRPLSTTTTHQSTTTNTNITTEGDGKPSSSSGAVVVNKKPKTVQEADEELRQKLEAISGEGGEAGLELEGGKPVAMKRGVRENMFRVI